MKLMRKDYKYKEIREKYVRVFQVKKCEEEIMIIISKSQRSNKKNKSRYTPFILYKNQLKMDKTL